MTYKVQASDVARGQCQIWPPYYQACILYSELLRRCGLFMITIQRFVAKFDEEQLLGEIEGASFVVTKPNYFVQSKNRDEGRLSVYKLKRQI